MNKYSKILISNFVMVAIFALLFRPIFLANMNLGLPVVLVITAVIIYTIYKALAADFAEYKKAVVMVSLFGFFCLAVINLLVASGMAKVFSSSLG